MKLKTIWTMHYMSLGERLARTRDWGAWAIAARLPLRIRFTTTLLELGKATTHTTNVPGMTLVEILQNLEYPKNMS
jgi:hypothetical protein